MKISKICKALGLSKTPGNQTTGDQHRAQATGVPRNVLDAMDKIIDSETLLVTDKPSRGA